MFQNVERKEWILNGLHHRKNGPAIVNTCDNQSFFFLIGRSLSFEEWWKRISEKNRLSYLFNQ